MQPAILTIFPEFSGGIDASPDTMDKVYPKRRKNARLLSPPAKKPASAKVEAGFEGFAQAVGGAVVSLGEGGSGSTGSVGCSGSVVMLGSSVAGGI